MRKKITLALLSLLLVPLGLMAQNVTVHPGNGNMLPALKSGQSDTFFGWNGFATWKHEQLSLTLTTGDNDNNSGTDADGNLARPANDIFATAADAKGNRYLQIGKGRKYSDNIPDMETYITFSLPKGYRFTSYSITFHRIPNPTPDGADVLTSNGKVYINSYEDNDYVDETSGDLAFGETTNSFNWTNTSGTYYGGIRQGNTTQHTISRTSQIATDMDNVLYFKLTSTESSGRAFIQLDHVEFEFTAENNYTPLIPAPNVTNQSAVDIPFTTSKMDYGELKRYDIDGNELTEGGRISYNGTIHDMNANLTLYEKGSVTEDQANGFDGTVGKMVAYGSGSISQAGDYFKLDASSPKAANIEKVTIDGEEKDAAIYYIETPVWAVNTASTKKNKNPIGYRITDASFECTSGNLKFPAVFKIQYESTEHSADQNGTYGLNYYNNSLSYNWNYQTEWRIDDEGYIYVGSTYLRETGSGNSRTLTTTPSKSNATRFVITGNQIQVRNTSRYIGWEETENGSYEWDGFFPHWVGDGTYTRSAITTTGSNRSTYNELSYAFSENIGSYTFLVFDKTGTEATAYTINGNRTIPLSGLNNDAVKIGVVSGGKAIVKGGLTLQALDPYIDRLNIVCQENGGTGGKVTQQFNATDFSVKGGAFTFYVPKDFKGNAKFTFEDLYSQYGDNSYYNAQNNPERHARYFFVGSPYSATNANAYYRSANANYDTKIDCLQPGNAPFSFNNAATATSTTGNEYEEYPFSVANYGGSFTNFIYNEDDMDHEPEPIVKTAYLFTCDETRYNIAPTTATQHVYYAFYRMDIDMKKHTYAPKLSWKKLYDNTFYSANNTDIVRDSQWGLKLTTDPVTDDQGTHSGYLTMTQLENAISNAQGIVKNIGKTVTGEISQFDINGDGQINKADLTAAGSSVEGGEDLLPPTKSNQILYIDGSNLMSIMENQTASTSGSTTTYTTHSLDNLQETLGKNALIYLPYGSRSELSNVASNTVSEYNKTPVFQGINDIVVHDRYPFYAPYDIQVKTAKMAKYERSVTNQTLLGDDDQHLTIVLPFEINVDANGVHKNDDNEGTPFMLAKMNSGNVLSKNSSEDFYADAYFTQISGEHSAANKPYVVTLQSQTAGESDFKVHVNGALVKATPNNTGILTGETASGTYTYKENDVNQTVEYNFTHKGTYTGIEIGEAAKGGAVASDTTVFYFANNYFLDSKTLVKGKTLKMLPFRSFYEYPSSAKAKMVKFRIVFGENDDDDTTGINAVQKNSTLAVIPGDGYITIMAKADSNVAIHTVNGMTVEKCNLRAGETRTVAMPSGIYVINGVKMVVR